MNTGREFDLAQRWQSDLNRWDIPSEILDQAPVPPWIHPVQMFTVTEEIPDSVSHQQAREALGDGGSVLDVGCGGGRATFGLAPLVTSAVGVDHQQGMLDEYLAAARDRDVPVDAILGDWPAVAESTPGCDVVVCHHVAYNVPDIVPFLQTLHDHARRRVVIELPLHHPLSTFNDLWEHFWHLPRPQSPTAHDLVNIAEVMGFDVRRQVWTDPEFGNRAAMSIDERVAHARIRLCLDESRDDELAAVLAQQPPRPTSIATIWWDVTPAR